MLSFRIASQIVVCPGPSGETYERLSFGNHFSFAPLITVVIIAANNGDESSNLATWLSWRDQIATALNALPYGLALGIEYDPPIDPGMIADSYDYLSLGMRVTLWH